MPCHCPDPAACNTRCPDCRPVIYYACGECGERKALLPGVACDDCWSRPRCNECGELVSAEGQLCAECLTSLVEWETDRDVEADYHAR